jgi:nitrite reductase/ring-hydroxylating ferredoxin subunit
LPTGAIYPVLINRGTGQQFFAINTRCTHMGCVVPTFNAAANASICPCHGSRYAIDGTVTAPFLPGQASLSRFPITFDGTDLLCVEMPNLGYSIVGTSLETGVGPRFQLQFQTRSGARYEVRSRQNLEDPGVVLPFSSTAEGTANLTSRTGSGGVISVYVDRAPGNGFYSVAVIVTQG